MLTVIAGADATIAVPFMRDGEPFVPDPTGLSWLLRDQAGAPGSPTDLGAITDSKVDIVVLAASNTIPGGELFSKRFVCVTGLRNGTPFTINVAYRIVPWINTTVSLDDVRGFIGVTAGELPDDAIDLTSAYLELVTSVGVQATVDAALSTGAGLEIQANTAIMANAVMDCIQSLQLRLSQSESDGSMSVERLGKIDLNALYKLATLEYSDAVTAISGRVINQRQSFVVILPTDPVTGV